MIKNASFIAGFRMKSSKKLCPRFLITFLLFEILVYITFLFPLKSELKIENPS